MPLFPRSQVAWSQGWLFKLPNCTHLDSAWIYKSALATNHLWALSANLKPKKDTEHGGASPDGDLAAWGIDRLIPIPPTLLPAMLVSRAPASRAIIARETVPTGSPLVRSPAPAHRKLRVSTPCPVNCVLEKPETLRRPAAHSRQCPPGYRVSIKPGKFSKSFANIVVTIRRYTDAVPLTGSFKLKPYIWLIVHPNMIIYRVASLMACATYVSPLVKIDVIVISMPARSTKGMVNGDSLML